MCYSIVHLMIATILIERSPDYRSFKNQTGHVNFVDKPSRLNYLWTIVSFVMKTNHHRFLVIILSLLGVRLYSQFVSPAQIFSNWSIRYECSSNQAFSPSAIFRRSVEILFTLTFPHFFVRFLNCFIVFEVSHFDYDNHTKLI